MTRPLRIEYPGAYYHVMNRGNNKGDVFFDERDRALFIGLLSELYERFGVQVLAYVLMRNHYHLLMHTPRGNLKEAMRHLGGLFTQKLNRIRGRDGHLFKGRYKALLIKEETYLRNVIRYIHLNPVKAGFVQNPKDWKYSSHRYYLAEDISGIYDFLNIRMGFSLFQNSNDNYVDFLKEGVDADTEKFYGRKKLPPYFGSEALKKDLRVNFLQMTSDHEFTPEIKSTPSRVHVMDHVALAFSITYEEIREAQKGSTNLALGLVMTLMRERSQMNHKSIMRCLGLSSDKAVSVGIHRFKKRLKYDEKLSDIYLGLSTCSM